MKHFKKEIHQNAVYDLAGRVVNFEPLQDGNGVIALDETKAENAQLIQTLDKMHSDRRGGILPITEGEYSRLKAVYPFIGFAPKSEPPIRLVQDNRRLASDVAVVDPASIKPILPNGPAPLPTTAPPPVLPADFKPRTGRLKNLSQAAIKELQSKEAAPVTG